jgi:formate dehydrogenase subunit delta
MHSDTLVTMANQIGSFFETMPDRQQALIDLAGHIQRFWEPRMRRALLQLIDGATDTHLSPIVLEAINTHRSSILKVE